MWLPYTLLQPFLYAIVIQEVRGMYVIQNHMFQDRVCTVKRSVYQSREN